MPTRYRLAWRVAWAIVNTALVTGASAGLGKEFAKQLAESGYHVVLVARSREGLDKVALLLREEYGASSEILVADLATAAGTDAVAARLRDAAQPVDLLVNNAGLGLGRAFVDNDLELELSAFDVMVRAVMILSHAAATSMRQRRTGVILNVSSVATWLGSGTYAAHKSWVTSFTEGLAGELRGTGVTATAVLPGLTRTEFHERAGIGRYEGVPESSWLTAHDVVAAALAGARKGRVLVTPSVKYRVISVAARLAPRSWVRAATRRKR